MINYLDNNLSCGGFEGYGFDGLSVQELLCEYYEKIEEHSEILQFLLDKGIDKVVAEIIAEKLKNGDFKDILDKQLLGDINRIKNRKPVIQFKDVATMKATELLEDGDMVKTVSNLTAGDGCGAYYKIKTGSASAEDLKYGFAYQLKNGLIAELLIEAKTVILGTLNTNNDIIDLMNYTQKKLTTDGGKIIIDKIYTVAPRLKEHYIHPFSNIEIAGVEKSKCGFKIKDNLGNHFFSLIWLDNKNDTGIENFTIRNLKFDYNYDGMNQAVDKDEFGQDVIFFSKTSKNILIEDNIFIAGSINMVSTTTDSQNIVVQNNYFEWIKNKLNTEWYDNSVIYLDCIDYKIINNTFFTKEMNSKLGAAGAIETHRGRCVCTGNIITGFHTGINVTAAHPKWHVPSGQHIISDNVMTDVEAGIRLWLNNTSELKDTIITNNTISINQVTRSKLNVGDPTVGWTNGINITFGSDEIGPKNLIISGNVIEFEDEDKDCCYVIRYEHQQMMGGIRLTCNGTVRGLQLTNNVIKNSPAQGINFIGGSEGKNKSKYYDVIISQNNIINPGLNKNVSSAFNCGFQFRNAYYCNVVCKDNIISSYTAMGRLAYAFDFGSEEFTYYEDCDIKLKNNKIYTAHGSGLGCLPYVTETKKFGLDYLGDITEKDVPNLVVGTADKPKPWTYFNLGSKFFKQSDRTFYMCIEAGYYYSSEQEYDSQNYNFTNDLSGTVDYPVYSYIQKSGQPQLKVYDRLYVDGKGPLVLTELLGENKFKGDRFVDVGGSSVKMYSCELRKVGGDYGETPEVKLSKYNL